MALILALLLLAGGFSCKKEKELTGTGLPKNSPPQTASVKILPEAPNKESLLSLVIESYDRDYDRILYRYQWLRDDEEIDGGNKEILRDVHLKKGDLIRVKVTPSDGKTEGQTFLSQPVKILNSIPTIKEIRIEPRIAYANCDLKAFVKSYDADGDSVNYTHKWEKNGVALSEENTEILLRNRFRKGDSIVLIAIPNDGETSGTAKRSEPILVANGPPMIISSPPNKTDGNIYTYQVKADDPDNDPIIFSLKTAPKGMEINRESGLIRWEVQKGDQGTQSVEIEASDSEGAKSFQRYTLSIEFR
jgi:hypothetical protein